MIVIDAGSVLATALPEDPLIGEQPIDGALDRRPDAEPGLPAQRPDARCVEKDERIVADPAAGPHRNS